MKRLFFGCFLSFFATQSPAAFPQPSGMLPLRPVPEAPENLKKAAQAIVLIETLDQGSGTGFFLKKSGALVTNAHVLGPENCTREGCYADLAFSLEHGGKVEKKHTFLVPLFTDAHWDISVFSVFLPTAKKPKAQRFVPSHGLEFSHDPAKGLVGREIFLLGHPFGGLKRWSSAAVFEIHGEWGSSEHCTPGGYSGSPMLDEKGEIVGIVHRALVEDDRCLSLENFVHTGTFSLAESFRGALENLNAEEPSKTTLEFTSIPFSGALSSEDAEDSLVGIGVEQMISRKLWSLTVRNGKKKEKIVLMDLLRDACRDQLKSEETFQSPDFSYDTCELGRDLLDCAQPWKGEEKSRCPTGESRRQWEEIFGEVAELLELKSQGRSLFWYLTKVAAFETSKESKRSAERKALEEIQKTQPFSLFAVTEHVARLSHKREEWVMNGIDYLKNLQEYFKQPFYKQYSIEIGMALESLAENKTLPAEEWEPLVARFLEDPKVFVSAKADLEHHVVLPSRGLLSPSIK